MISEKDFSKDELEGVIKQLKEFESQEGYLQEEVKTYFSTYDEDNNGFLDRRELRKFLREPSLETSSKGKYSATCQAKGKKMELRCWERRFSGRMRMARRFVRRI